MSKPKVIFLDAVGTLFGVKGGVGKVYSEIARDFGVDVSPKDIHPAFYHCYRQTPPLAFPDVSFIDIPEKEYYWWHDLVQATFKKTGALPQFDNFGAFFQQLYAYFTTPDPWIVYPDILPVLETWRRERVELGIISNFDSRLHGLIGTLELEKFFTSITISSASGAAKPEAKIFEIALKKHECQPENAWHIGDSVENDYKAAKKAGLRSFLLDRNHKK
ncbi:HAD-IA family hydrolase [Spirulina sp. 06S082]|uniref:HAD-IA family hydrolase n=1 Tax=Spirulina sp. 06S082 TaxID=3110248 RepID=UPI002B2125D2|nr:HAD-IA family hydrolase [Spirulina sp. 06S082]MEA5470853.1 HAD-IA family hydrolase [Spirulina sp. 06S082]